jgi:ATP-binding cassette, subfamily B (MDR/TAP), member 10
MLHQQIIFGLSPTQAAVGILALFTIGALSNGIRAILMRISGQRIVARLRNDTYASALR